MLFQEWDDALLGVVCKKLLRSEMLPGAHLPDWAAKLELEKRQMQLPVHYGGIGLRPLTVISKVAYLAGLASCSEEILLAIELMPGPIKFAPIRYEEQYEACRRAVIDMAPALKDAVFEKFSPQIDGEKLKLLPTSLKAFLRQFQKYPILAEKFQKRLSKPIWEAKFNDLVAKHRATGDIAGCRRLQSYRGGGLAGRIWTMIPSLPCLRHSNSHLGMALRLQTGALPAAWMYSVKGKLMCRATRST